MSVTTADGVSSTLVQPAIYRGAVAPTSAAVGDLWEDTSVSPPVLKQCSAAPDTFVPVGGTSSFDPASPGPIGGTTPAAGTFTTLTATGQASLGGAPDSESLRVLSVASAVNYLTARGATSGSSVALGAAGLNGGIATIVQSKGSAGVELWTNGGNQRQFVASHTSSAVNYVQVTGAATTGIPVISAQGSDASVSLAIQSKGTSPIVFHNGSSQRQLRIDGTGVGTNYFGVASSATAFSPVFGVAVQSADTNVSAVFQSKGTGAIDLAAGSSGVNISNGGTVTALTRTGTGSGYTSNPTVTISAPTTAGGVQATASTTWNVYSVPITSGGTGYTVGDVLTLVGGTFTDVLQLTVSTVSGGVVTGVTVLTPTFGIYSVIPTNPCSVTGGTGSGATFSPTWSLRSIAVNNAGSGYVEQPTVSFSGGGGSGAAALAQVGGNAVITSLGSSLLLNTARGTALQVASYGSNMVNSYAVYGSSSFSPAILESRGSDTNINAAISSKGTGFVSFFTNAFSQGTGSEQLRVAHTASAVNYVQVTGAATGGGPTISAQGSDSNVNLNLNAKGTGSVLLQVNGTNAFQVSGSGTLANRLQATGVTAGNTPSLASVGSDTNIDLTLTPKGTGNVRFGTYTANMALTVQGYIEIKDSGGTVRKLAVIA